MIKYEDNLAARINGNNLQPLAGALVTVTDKATSLPASLYQDDELTPIAQPLTTDNNGYFAFRAADGRYTLTFSAGPNSSRFDTFTRDAVLEDPADNPFATLQELALPSGAGRSGFQQAGEGAIVRTVLDELRERVTITQFGADGGGSANARTALVNAMATLEQVVIPRGNWFIGSDLTISKNVSLRFAPGAQLVIPDGVTVTFDYAEIDAGRQKIFNCTGTGKVAGALRNAGIYPEWWGAIADGLHPPAGGTDFSARAAAALRNGVAFDAALAFAGNLYSSNINATATIDLSYGCYVTDRTFKITLSVNVVGKGISYGIFYYAPTGNAVEMIDTNNSMLRDFFIAPLAGPTWNYTTGHGLYMNGVSTPCVENVWCSQFGAGDFYIESVIEGRLRGLISDNSNGPSFTIRGVGRGTVLDTCVTAGTKNGACFDISGYDWQLIGCTAKDGDTGTNGFYLNACENINMSNCAAYDINREAYVVTASALSCNLSDCMAYDASYAGSGLYNAFQISGQRNKLIGCKATANTPKYKYGISLGGGGVDCTSTGHTITPGTLGTIEDAQPTGSNTYHVHKVSTTDATPLNIWFKAVNNNAAATLEATVTAKQRGATGASATYKFWCHVRTNSTDTALLAPSTPLYSYESNAALDASFVLTSSAANAGVVSLRVTGIAGNPVDWEAEVKVLSVTG